MAEERAIHPVTKQILELGPPILFFVVYLWIRDETFTIGGIEYSGFIIAAIGFVPILLASTAILWKLTGQLSRMQVFVAVMVVVFGGLTFWLNDERFFKMKTSIVYAVFAGLLGVGLMRGQSYLAFVMNDALPMMREGWMILTRRLAFVFVLMAAANEFVWRTMSTDFWVKFETFGLPLALMAFLWIQIMALQKYFIETPGQD